jgi:putative heme transporter
LKVLILVLVLYFAVPIIVPGFRNAADKIRDVKPSLIALGFALEMAALYSYSLLTRAALGSSGKALSSFRLFRIQMSTKALSSVVPGGSAAGSALGYRLMTMSGVAGPDAGFALATAGLGSAVVLNIIFLTGLIVSIPIRGVNPGYAFAAIFGIILLILAGALIFGLLEGNGRSERVLRWFARKLHLSEDRAAAGARHVGARLEELASDRQLLARVVGFAIANWLLDAAALWVFLRAFGASTDVDAVIVAFAAVNVLAVIPITPGGLGTIDLGLPLALVGFGLSKDIALLGVAAWRLFQYYFPILLGGLLYGSLRVGPWSIKRRERLSRLRDLAASDATSDERALDFSVRFGRARERQIKVDPIDAYPIAGESADESDEAGRDLQRPRFDR